MAALAVEPLSVRVCLLGGGLPDLMVEQLLATLRRLSITLRIWPFSPLFIYI
jgi:hypothetical protein